MPTNTAGEFQAPVVTPGQSSQKLADVRLLIPNSAFEKGDVVDLYLYSRSDAQLAPEVSGGTANSSADTKLGFDSTPTVKVSGPFDNDSVVGSTTDANSTENPTDGPDYTKVAVGNPAGYVDPTNAPEFGVSLAHTSRAQFQGTNDIVRLTVKNQATTHSDPNKLWEVTVSGLTAQVGSDVTPGELRVAPFLYNKSGSFDADQGYDPTTLKRWFNKSHPQTRNSTFNPDNSWHATGTIPTPASSDITSYTVVGYVAPATFGVQKTDLQADGLPQNVGDVTITETSNIGLQADTVGNGGTTYTIHISGATVDTSNLPKIAIASTPAVPAGMENTVDPITAADVNNSAVCPPGTQLRAPVECATIDFTITTHGQDSTHNNAWYDDLTKDKLTLSNLFLKTNNADGHHVQYSLTGGSVDNGPKAFLIQAGTGTSFIGSPAVAPYGQYGVRADSLFGSGINPLQAVVPAPYLTQAGKGVAVNQRIGGADRYSTAAKLAVATLGSANTIGGIIGGPRDLVIASGENFPDALSANYLAATRGTAIVLTKANSVPQVTMDAIRTTGVTRVFLVGGPDAISKKVQSQLENTRVYDQAAGEVGQSKLQVTRIGGSNRYATNHNVDLFASANSLLTRSVGVTNFTYGEAGKQTALVATGEDYADGVAAGAAVTSGPQIVRQNGAYPLVLTKGGTLNAQAEATLDDLGIEQAVLVGGTTTLPTAVETAISGKGIAVTRAGGDNRYETAAALADLEVKPYYSTPTKTGGFGMDDQGQGVDDQVALLATGEAYPDALAAGPYAANYDGEGLYADSPAPILLTAQGSLPKATQDWLTAHAKSYGAVQALGLTQAISQAALTAANQAIS